MLDSVNDLMSGAAEAIVSLPIAAFLGVALAFRPRRRGTPPRNPAVIQTQVILAIMGALIMAVVGASVARAFGIVGAASLIRYRAKISDPKDAAVMLSTLGVGLAAGVGLYGLAIVATVFILAVLWFIESLERHAYKLFELTITSKTAATIRPSVEHLLARHHARAELRTLSAHEMMYSVHVPIGTHVDNLSVAIVGLDRGAEIAVEWDEKRTRSS
jgi:uncharacterized membrane protein YhiD involved in acid resistance